VNNQFAIFSISRYVYATKYNSVLLSLNSQYTVMIVAVVLVGGYDIIADYYKAGTLQDEIKKVAG